MRDFVQKCLPRTEVAGSTRLPTHAGLLPTCGLNRSVNCIHRSWDSSNRNRLPRKSLVRHTRNSVVHVNERRAAQQTGGTETLLGQTAEGRGLLLLLEWLIQTRPEGLMVMGIARTHVCRSRSNQCQGAMAQTPAQTSKGHHLTERASQTQKSQGGREHDGKRQAQGTACHICGRDLCRSCHLYCGSGSSSLVDRLACWRQAQEGLRVRASRRGQRLRPTCPC